MKYLVYLVYLVSLVVVVVVLLVVLSVNFQSKTMKKETSSTLLGLVVSEENSSDVLRPTQSLLQVNPGCRSGSQLYHYKSIDTGKVYYHPPIVQYAKLSKGKRTVTLNFRDYMSVMSAYKFLSPEKIIIHTFSDIEGKYWDLTQKWNGTVVEVNMLQPMSKIGGKSVSYISHEADYIKLQGLLKYGGVVSDFDVIVVNGTRLEHFQKISECVLSREGEFVNAGFSSCIKNSSYVQKWLDIYHTDYRPNLWIYNASIKPTYILTDHTSKVCYNMYLDPTICLNPNAGKEKMKWLKRNGVNWRSKTAAHYFLKHSFQHDDDRLLEMDHSMGDMFRYVYNA